MKGKGKMQTQTLYNHNILSELTQKTQDAKQLAEIFSAFRSKINLLQSELNKIEGCLSDVQDVLENHIWNKGN